MRKLVFVGDVHGKFAEYRNIVESTPLPTFQVGDMGIGFVANPPPTTSFLKTKDMWIHGNHDDPEVCKNERGYLGRYGVTDPDVFFMSGALSLDIYRRLHGFTVFAGEELNFNEMNLALDLYVKTKPKVLVCHEAPASYHRWLLDMSGKSQFPTTISNTGQCLQAMIEAHRPDILVHGHWHIQYDRYVDGCHVYGLGELGTQTLEF